LPRRPQQIERGHRGENGDDDSADDDANGPRTLDVASGLGDEPPEDDEEQRESGLRELRTLSGEAGE
jgi:hypothetical protein